MISSLHNNTYARSNTKAIGQRMRACVSCAHKPARRRRCLDLDFWEGDMPSDLKARWCEKAWNVGSLCCSVSLLSGDITGNQSVRGGVCFSSHKHNAERRRIPKGRTYVQVFIQVQIQGLCFSFAWQTSKYMLCREVVQQQWTRLIFLICQQRTCFSKLVYHWWIRSLWINSLFNMMLF